MVASLCEKLKFLGTLDLWVVVGYLHRNLADQIELHEGYARKCGIQIPEPDSHTEGANLHIIALIARPCIRLGHLIRKRNS